MGVQRWALIGALVVMGLVLGGCDGGSPIGTWTFNKDRSKAVFADWVKGASKYKSDEERQRDIKGHAMVIDGMALVSGSRMPTVTFQQDGSCTFSEPSGREVKGTWKQEGGSVTVQPGEPNQPSAKVSVSGGELILMQQEMPFIVFTRSSAAASPAPAPKAPEPPTKK